MTARAVLTLPEPRYRIEGKDIRIYVAADDVAVPPVAMQRYATAFGPSGAEFRVFTPADHSLPTPGHIEVLWQLCAPVWPIFPTWPERSGAE